MEKITFVIFSVFDLKVENSFTWIGGFRPSVENFKNFKIFDRAPIALWRSSFDLDRSIGPIEGLDRLTAIEFRSIDSIFDRRKGADLRSTSIALRRSNLRSIDLDRLTAIEFCEIFHFS